MPIPESSNISPTSTTTISTAASQTTTPALGRCPLCGAPLKNPDECSMCDWTLAYDESQQPLRRNPRDAIAFILSIMWPGLGHYAKGYTQLGVGLAFGGLVCVLWAIMFLMFFGFLFPPIYWLWIAIDAFLRKDLKYPEQASAHAATTSATSV